MTLWHPQAEQGYPALIRPRRKLRLADWGHGMSICIVAIAERSKMVIAADTMVSLQGGAFSADATMTKGMELVPHRWGAAFAGDDVSRALPLLARVKKELSGRNALTVEDVAGSLVRGYHAERTALAVETHLGIYSLDMPQFLSNGANIFQDGFGVMRERIEQVTLGCECLLHGFDHEDAPHIVSVEHPGVAQFINIGYWAIGSGAPMAFTRLSLRQQAPYTSLEETIYNVCEAKSAAQRALGVGKLTVLMICEPGQSVLTLSAQVSHEVLSVSEQALIPDVPKDLIESIGAEVAHLRAKRKLLAASSPPAATPSPPRSTRGRKRQPPSQE